MPASTLSNRYKHKETYRNKKTNEVTCGILPYYNKSTEFYIIGGNKAQYMQFPWMVLLIAQIKKDTKMVIMSCGATLITSKFAVSAAHCFYSNGTSVNYKKYRLYIGVNNLKKKEKYKQILRIKKVIVHRKYNFTTSINDISLVQLSTPINFKNTMIRPICLPKKADKDILYEDKAIVAGWGVTDEAHPKFQNELLFVSLSIMPKLKCIIISQFLHDTTELEPYRYKTTLCTFELLEKSPCSGDSGGPLMGICKKTGKAYFLGIMSFSNCFGFTEYTKVSYFLDWIRVNIA